MKFSLFRKNKKTEQTEEPAAPPQEPAQTEATAASEASITETEVTQTAEPEIKRTDSETVMPIEPSAPETPTEAPIPVVEVAEPSSKTYLKAMPLKELADVEKVKNEILSGNIVILKLTPLAKKSLDDVKMAVNELDKFSVSVDGDIGRLGEERVVICPKNVRIWREKTPVHNEPMPMAASTAA